MFLSNKVSRLSRLSRNRMAWIAVCALALMIGIALFGATYGVALAHEHRTVGDYHVEFGWQAEPAIVGLINGPEVYIEPADDSLSAEEALQGVEVALQVEVTFGPASRVLTLDPDSEEIGHYTADLIPTRPGDYSFHLTGTIGETPVDEVFTSADGQFGSVDPASDLQFPEPQPDVTELLQRIEALEAEVQALQAASGQ